MGKKLYFFMSFAMIFLALTIFLVHDSYAKYLTALNETTNIRVARWRILVNNNDIRANNTASAVVTPVFYQNNHIANNIIAPTSEGYFDLVIDSSGADVSFNYSLDVGVNSTSAVQDLVVTGYQVNNGQTVSQVNTPLFQDQVLYSSGVTSNTIRVFIKWDDSANATMNNAADTLAADGTAKLDVTLQFQQVAS
jgi:hypothetical protein